MSQRLEIGALEDLALQLRALEAARPRRSRRRLALIAAAVTIGLAGSAGATAVVLHEGPPFREPSRRAVPPDLRTVPGSGALAAARAPDPVGGPDWGVRISRNARGDRCTAAGRVLDGKLGLMVGGSFRTLPLSGAAACDALRPGQPLTMTATVPAHETARTVIHGVATPAVARIELRAGAAVRSVAPSADGSYVAVFAGTPDVVRTIHFTDGSTQVLDPRR